MNETERELEVIPSAVFRSISSFSGRKTPLGARMSSGLFHRKAVD